MSAMLPDRASSIVAYTRLSLVGGVQCGMYPCSASIKVLPCAVGESDNRVTTHV